jgi:hypothetical protein
LFLAKNVIENLNGIDLIHYYLRLDMFLANDDTTPFNPEKTNLACFSNGLVTFGIKDISFNLLSKNEDVFSIEPELSARK